MRHNRSCLDSENHVLSNYYDLLYILFFFAEKKSVLKGITGTFKSGELTAIMGPSGAGKSSLMNILTGLTKTGVSGTIEIGKARKLCGYIMQDDHFYSFFTVEETMLLAATLKISNECIDMKEKRILVSHVSE